ncbi:hypothetical protein D3870_17690 [Noviherbaspirillum cavernae]|uniref:Uncharacterized protein n=2 Tax=Noviherbaspirillum cavernae TaxID=2320862 RepID=A0A418X539_9BURK|nr:hypothetical protein D3870_17690 [Noviherbaspirillum cavernae]
MDIDSDEEGKQESNNAGKRSSLRLHQQKLVRDARLTQARKELGVMPLDHSNNDVSEYFTIPLSPGVNGVGYTAEEAHKRIKEKLEDSARTETSLDAFKEESGDATDKAGKWKLPLMAFALREEAASLTGKNATDPITSTYSKHNDDPNDSRREYHTYTEYTENIVTLPRNASHTPNPHSRDPSENTGVPITDLNGKPVRYEKAHQAAFQFTGQAGGTVWVPTQGNQAVDSRLERFIKAGKAGGFIYRYDTANESSLYAVRRNADDGWELRQASYKRRQQSLGTSSSGPTSASTNDGSSGMD